MLPGHNRHTGVRETLFERGETPLKHGRAPIPLGQFSQGCIMFNRLFDLIFHLSCRSTLIELGSHKLAR